MQRIRGLLKSSIGKKLLMAVTGFGFIGFLMIHLAGMMTLYSGQEAFVAYGEGLHVFGKITISLVEWSLLFFAIIHVGIGLTLFVQNRMARPQRYTAKVKAGGQTFASKTMPYTGLLILGFLLIHLAHFRFAGAASTTVELYDVVAASFKNGGYALVYMPAMVILAIHISHGFWSAFQTIGLKRRGLMPFIRAFGFLFSILVAAGFGFIPIYFLFFP